MTQLPLALLTLVGTSHALTLTVQETRTVAPGVVYSRQRASSPGTTVHVLQVDLCADDVYVDARKASSSSSSTGSWASSVDATVATNGDFYKTGPLRVYGDAVGNGVAWPLDQTGLDPAYASEWYPEHYGFIAFRHDDVVWSHSCWVKDHVDGLTTGWRNDDLTPDLPPGTIALVSGFPEVVVEGEAMVCDSPTASDCFPDRSDMRDRHPRTAMGLSEDGETFWLVVADGRTSSDAGLYGSELADVMGQLGAWTAFNLDGGGSSQMWSEDEGSSGGYVNEYSGNNSGGGARSMANHWGVFAGGRDWLPERPGHCASAAPCQSIPPEGGIVDDASTCFRAFGDQDYWRSEAAGHDGHLWWTNAFQSDVPDNWAWWRLELEDAGRYELFVSADATFSVHDDVRYEVRAGGATSVVTVDPSGIDGWVRLGEFELDAGGDQWIALFDDEDASPGSDQHIVADAVQLVRLDLPEGGEDSGGGEETGVADSGEGDGGADGGSDGGEGGDGAGDGGAGDGGAGDGGGRGERIGEGGGCAAAPGAGAVWVGILVGGLGGWRRRRLQRAQR